MNNDFNAIQFSKAEKEILNLMKEGKNLYEIAQELDKSTSTITNQLMSIYNKTKDVVKYESKLKRFSALRSFLENSDYKKEFHAYTNTPNQQNNKKESLVDEFNRLKKENEELKEKIKNFETAPKADFVGIKNKIKADIEKLSQKLHLIEELENLMRNEL